MPTYVTYFCQQCGNSYQQRKGDRPGKYCTRSCAAKARGKLNAERMTIPDGQPMSLRTQYRRKQAAGLTSPVVPVPFNESFFDMWSDEMAWLLGLIWSDGCLIAPNSVEICSKDKELIDLVSTLINGGLVGTKNKEQHFNIRFTSSYTATRLRALGLTVRKSFTVSWPTELPTEYEGSFLRGMIDGDGSVLTRKLRNNQYAPDLQVQIVTASPFLRDAIQDFYVRSTILFSVNERDNSIKHPGWSFLWTLIVVRQESLHKLYNLLYPSPDVPCLARKRIPFDSWIAAPRRKGGRPATGEVTSPFDPSSTKVCSKCGQEKTLDGFYRDTKKKCGRRPSCIDCERGT